MNSKEFNKLAKSVDKYGLGLASFIALIILMGVFARSYIKTSDKYLDLMVLTEKRITKLEAIVEILVKEKDTKDFAEIRNKNYK